MMMKILIKSQQKKDLIHSIKIIINQKYQKIKKKKKQKNLLIKKE